MLIPGILMLLAVSTLAQQPRQIRVSVQVSSDDVVESRLLSNINGGLRRLGDVVVVDDDAKFHVSVVALKNTLSAGVTVGYVVSIVVTESEMSPGAIQHMIDEGTNSRVNKTLLSYVCTQAVKVVYHSLLIGPDDLQEISKRVVAEVDAGPIETERKNQQELDDKLKKKS
jgi:hypothetical protein